MLPYHLDKIQNVLHKNTQNFLKQEYAGESVW